MKWQKIIFWVAAIFVFNETAHACEPIIPFIKVVGGPAMLVNSWIILLAVVAVKAIIFSTLQKRLRACNKMNCTFLTSSAINWAWQNHSLMIRYGQ